MRLSQKAGEIFVPGGLPQTEALRRTTHLAIGAHPDDLELMTWHGILSCFRKRDHGFTGVVVTDGAGSPRAGPYASHSADAMRATRLTEQKKAAVIGEYAALVYLGFSSDAVKAPDNTALVRDLTEILNATRPEVVYTHNLFDAHETHVAVAVHLIRAIRQLPKEQRPKSAYGCEVWRSLDWLPAEDKAVFDVSGHDELAAALIGVHDSQIAGGKRYDLAAVGRRRANATYGDPRTIDQASAMEVALDLTPLIRDPALDIHAYALAVIQRFAAGVSTQMRGLLP
jgi:LmbE family N-acetylglucosaminyl deacetylase